MNMINPWMNRVAVIGILLNTPEHRPHLNKGSLMKLRKMLYIMWLDISLGN